MDIILGGTKEALLWEEGRSGANHCRMVPVPVCLCACQHATQRLLWNPSERPALAVLTMEIDDAPPKQSYNELRFFASSSCSLVSLHFNSGPGPAQA